MRTPPIPENEALRLDALRTAYCAYAPREDRFSLWAHALAASGVLD
ncbi:MAG: hypothetical protein Q8K05_04715 [Polaromonas sp.]|jgi:hypothetical protein|nr:hypothetical protein [Polaromonas sp.]MDP2255350.1 hypothetical protein [Polaromonas sp.]